MGRAAPEGRTACDVMTPQTLAYASRLRQQNQHPPKNAARKSKKSWELTTESPLKSAAGSLSKNSVRKSKKSCELTAESLLKSAGHDGLPPLSQSTQLENSRWKFAS